MRHSSIREQGSRRDAARSARPSVQLLWLLGLAILLAVPSLAKPDLFWEWIELSAAEAILETGVPRVPLLADGPWLIHPPTGPYIVAASWLLLGESIGAARLPGLLQYLLTGFLLWKLVLASGLRHRVAVAATAIYLTNPMALQGMLTVGEPDASLLPLTAVLFCLLMVTASSRRAGAQVALVAACLCLAFWGKYATAVVLVIAFVLVALLEPGRRWSLRRLAATLGITALLGLSTWTLYCGRVGWTIGQRDPSSVGGLILAPVHYLLSGQAGHGIWGLPIASLVGTLVRLTLYAGPLLVLFALPPAWRWVRSVLESRALPSGSIMPLFTLGILSLYSLFLGGVGPFPKYFLPAVPFFSIWAAVFLAQRCSEARTEPEEVGSDQAEAGSDQAEAKSDPWRAPRAWAAVAFFLAVAYYALVVGDNVYRLNYGLRSAMLVGGGAAAVWELALGLGLYFLPVVGLVVARRRLPRRLGMRPHQALLGVLLASQIAMCLLQGLSDYSLRYTYGTPFEAMREVEAVLSGLPPGRAVMANPMFLYSTRSTQVNVPTDWSSPDRLGRTISKERPQAVVYGLPTNTVAQVRLLQSDPGLQAVLSGGYDLVRIEPFWVWRKKSGGSESAYAQPPDLASPSAGRRERGR